MYPEKKGGSHKMARPQQNWGLLTLLTRRVSIWTMPNTASPKSEPPCGRAIYNPVRATILGHPPQKTAPGGIVEDKDPFILHDQYNVWLLMSSWCKAPRHQQPEYRYWLCYPRVIWFQYKEGYTTVSWKKSFILWLEFHKRMFLRIPITLCQNWFK